MDKTLIDATVWIEFFNGNLAGHIKNKIIDLLDNDKIFYNDIVLAEIIVGAKTKREENFIQANFPGFNYIHLESQDYMKMAGYGKLLRSQGKTVAIADLLVLTTVKEYGLTLLTKDSHFNVIKSSIDFKLENLIADK